MENQNPINQTHLIIAAISASFAKALDKHNPGVKEEFLKELGERYHEIREYSHPHIEALETLTWTRDFLNKD
ncbi:hypothetical protein [Acinetobacter junii]|uniref:Uncharacterized protein n=1 Tax=Acinetobacter junii TaxID=40215 RepID=A0AAX1MDV5_ACIJU|nr:hypothetical protein [Acinetobacter junii]QUY35638.1 hypothetical protein H2677_10145 [Acinetobacter junii]RZG70470.1 hypothetical protein EXE26_02015 [Acinetobacter junii]